MHGPTSDSSFDRFAPGEASAIGIQGIFYFLDNSIAGRERWPYRYTQRPALQQPMADIDTRVPLRQGIKWAVFLQVF